MVAPAILVGVTRRLAAAAAATVTPAVGPATSVPPAALPTAAAATNVSPAVVPAVPSAVVATATNMMVPGPSSSWGSPAQNTRNGKKGEMEGGEEVDAQKRSKTD